MYVASFPGPCLAFRPCSRREPGIFSIYSAWEVGTRLPHTYWKDSEYRISYANSYPGCSGVEGQSRICFHMCLILYNHITTCTVYSGYINTLHNIIKLWSHAAVQVCCTSFHNARRKVVGGSVTTCLLLNNVHTTQEYGYKLL